MATRMYARVCSGAELAGTALVAAIIASVVLARAGQAATIIVDLRGGADHAEIQPAIDAAKIGDTVLVEPGEYVITEPITFKGKAITVKGEAGPDQTIIRMADVPANLERASVVVFENKESSDAVLEGFTITGGKGTAWRDPEWPPEVWVPRGGGVHCSAGSSPTITDCTIVENSAFGQFDDGNGGGISCAEASSPTLTRCRISRNSAANDAGGLFCHQSSPTLLHCAISANSSRMSGGGLWCYQGSPTLLHCTISGNSTWWEGGGVKCSDDLLTLTNCTIAGNSARLGGGMFCDGNSMPLLTSCIVWDNVGSSDWSSSWGGALDGAPPVVRYSCVESREVWPGPGNMNQDPLFCGWGGRAEIWVDPSRQGPGEGTQANPYAELTAPKCRFSYRLSRASPCLGAGAGGCDMGADTGSCDTPGGAALLLHLAPGTYQARDLELAHHVSVLGAGKDATIIEGTVNGLRTGTAFSHVTVTKGNTGIRLNAESPEISHCRVTGNTTDHTGGGIYVWYASPTIANCEIVGNSAGIGGGVLIEDYSSPILANCRISGNSVQIGAAGVYSYLSTPTMTNCLISGNHSLEFSGGVEAQATSFVIVNCTIAGNSAKEGGGLLCSEASPTVINSIMWGNENGSLASFDSTLNVSFSCVDGDAPWPGEGNVNADPVFDAPGHWESCAGPEEEGSVPLTWDDSGWIPLTWGRWVEGDYYLESGSSCIDAGISKGAPTTDLEGNSRPCGAAVDMGAYEAGGCGPTIGRFRRGDVNLNGALNITDPIVLLGHLFVNGGAALSCLDAADADDNGKLNITDAIHSLRYLFLSGPLPPAPFPDCGADGAEDGLGCALYPSCN